ncbi:hypothetical protein [Christiangramia sediminis]|uniref:Uncharacterized protein n=1 Tax=Christiangramia sediminis TaxID=2881336 RepID=A0A9X1LKL3_9FLAO|nr:hypothetical protein [Christiangramia sediminis]MCB7482110.1 hypothetical protein [Christiangramia sediminis]
MNIKPITWLYITSLILVLVAACSYFNVSFPIVFFLVVTGQLFLIYTVYRILTEKYTTTKTFDDFYEDHFID